MINVNVIHGKPDTNIENLTTMKYYSCNHKGTNKLEVFFVCPKFIKTNLMVIWITSNSESGLNWNDYSVLEKQYCNFREIKDAELTFYT